MKPLKKIMLTLLMVMSVFSLGLSAEEAVTDNAGIKAMVQEELKKLLSDEAFMQDVFKKGIDNYIRNQQAETEAAEQKRQADMGKNLMPVDPKRDHIAGEDSATVTLIEYSDFECPFCKRSHQTMLSLMDKNKGKLRWVYRHFPLDFHNPGAIKQAEASECVASIAGNDQFWKFTDEIFQRTKSNGKGFPVENLRPLAEELGIDGTAFSECLDSGKMAGRVTEDIENGRAVGITGTPASFIINERGDLHMISGAQPENNFQAVIDALAKNQAADQPAPDSSR
ncbi:MAG: thioredoxin domain-containing protein [Thiothrix sp.]|nr:thioredoxin domain-containing protein [Thiothrix sp.]HPE60761.1 DsbA family protein [Thiolinea sp.]